MKNLKSPNIPAIYDVEEDEVYTYIVEEYIEGESLGALVRHRLLSEKEVFHFAIRISSIIQYLHSLPERIIYLDIKPENIIISEGEAYLIDFGSAISSAAGERQTGYVTPDFGAPEQKSGSAVDFSTDIYAMGRLLEFMVSHSTISEKSGHRLAQIIARCGMDVRWLRITNADTLKKMLERAYTGETKRHNKKRARRDRRRGGKIGVLGLGAGDGATHIAVALANYLADTQCRSVCLIEQSGHRDIGKLFADERGQADATVGPIRKNGVTYITEDMEGRQEYLLHRNFDCMVFDLGSSRNRAMKVLELCDIRILVAGAAPWRREKIDFLTKAADAAGHLKGWILLVNLTDEAGLRNMPNPGIPMLPFPLETSPLCPGKETVRTFERAMR